MGSFHLKGDVKTKDTLSGLSANLQLRSTSEHGGRKT
jgi:hypothetical protein